MSQSRSDYIFGLMKEEHIELFRLGKIEFIEEELLNASVHKLHRLYRNLITVLTILDTAEPIDYEFYIKLSGVSNGELRKSEIEQDDPFYPIYKHMEILIEAFKYLKEFSNPDGINSLPKDLLVKLILSSKENFLSNLNISMCKKYTLKNINDPYKRIEVEPATKKKINRIYFKYFNTQQEIFKVYLTTDQMKLPEFISELSTYNLLITSYNEFCSDENVKEINQNFTAINNHESDVPYVKYDNSISNNTITDESNPVLPNAIKPEALTLEQNFPFRNISYNDSRNFMLAESSSVVSRDFSSRVSSKSDGLYGQLSLLIFILMLLGFFKKIY